MDEPLFEVVTEADYLAATASTQPSKSRKSKHSTEDRTHAGWYRLPHTVHGYCTVPLHAEVQAILSDEKKEFREKYPTRMLYPIGEYLVCKDCYLVSADTGSAERGLSPMSSGQAA